MALQRTSQADMAGSLKKSFGNFLVPALAKNAVLRKISIQNRTDSVQVSAHPFTRSTQFREDSVISRQIVDRGSLSVNITNNATSGSVPSAAPVALRTNPSVSGTE